MLSSADDAPWSLIPTKVDLFDDMDVACALGLDRRHFLWVPQQADAVDDLWSAARYCIDLLRTRADLRQRFPDALSAGASGAFAQWLAAEGGNLLNLSSDARDSIGRALGADLSNHIRQLYLARDDLRAFFPLALTPAGRREFFRWVLRDGRELPGVRLETIWWFFLECAENPSAELTRTYLFTPKWQSLFPDGLTVFGRAKFAAWLAEHYGLDADWAKPSCWPLIGTPAENIRLAYALREDWHGEQPGAFESQESAENLLGWLNSPGSGLTEDPLAWCRTIDTRTVAKELAASGVNILGHFCYPSGLRKSVKSIAESLKRAGVRVSLRDIWSSDRDVPRHSSFNGLEYYDVTINHTEPESIFDDSYARGGLQPRDPRTYRIGYWYWELDTIPKSWIQQATQVDELWGATKFVTDAMRHRFGLPVFQMMPGLELPNFMPRPRDYFGLSDKKFIFLFVFHMMSIMERKNPLSLIKAFRKAFGNDSRVSLVLKTSFGETHPGPMAQMREAVAGTSITIIDEIYSEEETLSLISACDCYVSLHRSEGWGLTMAEAMLLGKPVIATGYSGNMDFMDNSNSLLVDYQIVTLERAYPPYAAGFHWANPSVDHAAQLMRQVYENQTWARDLGATAAADLNERLSVVASGRRMAARLAEIEAERRSQILVARGLRKLLLE